MQANRRQPQQRGRRPQAGSSSSASSRGTNGNDGNGGGGGDGGGGGKEPDGGNSHQLDLNTTGANPNPDQTLDYLASEDIRASG